MSKTELNRFLLEFQDAASNASRRKKILFLIGFDVFMASLSAIFALYLRLGFWLFDARSVGILILLSVVTLIPSAAYFGVYRNMLRYYGLFSSVQIGKAAFVSSLVMAIVILTLRIDGIPRTLCVLVPVTFVVFSISGRSMLRTLLTKAGSQDGKETKRTLIYGAGGHGRQLAASMRLESSVRLVGFLDDDITLDRRKIDNLPIFDAREMELAILETRAEQVIVALPNISHFSRRSIIDRLQRANVHTRLLPELKSLVDGSVKVADVREIRIDDLLGRDSRLADPNLLRLTVAGKRVLVTGAGGSIGSELCRQIIELEPELLLILDLSEAALYAIDQELLKTRSRLNLLIPVKPILGSITDKKQLERLFREFSPQTVYHAAAFKHVPLVEANPLSGVHNNVLGTFNLAETARDFGLERFILISTDKAVRPTNIMGASKRICELVLQAFAETARLDPINEPQQNSTKPTIFGMVRFGNVLGSSGSVVPLFDEQIRRGGPVTLTHSDVTRFFMTIPEAAQLVMQAGSMAAGGDVFLLDMGEPVKIYDLARKMIRLAGHTIKDNDNPGGDIAIEYIGLRPGEKLQEELLIGTNSQGTRHPSIMRSNEHFFDEREIREAIHMLRDAITHGKLSDVMHIIRTLVPEYGPAAHDLARVSDADKGAAAPGSRFDTGSGDS